VNHSGAIANRSLALPVFVGVALNPALALGVFVGFSRV